MSFKIFLPYLFVMAIVTYLIRAIPLVLVKHKIKNKFFNAGLVVAVILAYQRKSLIVVAIGACAAVFIIEGIITLM